MISKVANTEKSRALSSVYEIEYCGLLTKLDYLAQTIANEDGNGYAISKSAFFVTKELIKKLSELKIIEQNIAIHLFANMANGVQIELDSDTLKADIEVLEGGDILVTKYTGESNKAEENRLSVGKLYLLDEYLTLNEAEHA